MSACRQVCFRARTSVGLLSGCFVALLAGCGGGVGLGGDSQQPDPVVADNPVAFVKRSLNYSEDGLLIGDDVRDPFTFQPGGVLYLKDRASPSAVARDLTSRLFEDESFLNEDGELLYDVKDLEVSYDGKRLLFALRAPEIENADADEQPTWNIWEYDTEAGSLRRLIESDTVAEAAHDIAPFYLPDGRIVFSSTRQRTSRAILLDEGKPQFAAQDEDRRAGTFNLHIMDADGSNIRQLTFNQSHDLDPYYTREGRIVFTRWDNAGSVDGMNLYAINPDGTGLTLLYGRHSHESGTDESMVQFLKPRELEDGSLLVQLRDYQTNQFTSVPTEVSVTTHADAEVAIDGAGEPGQEALIPNLRTDEEPVLAGQYSAVFPLDDGTGRLLVSWSLCRLINSAELAALAEDEFPRVYNCTQERLDSGDYVPADPVYGLWIYDPSQNTQLPIETPEEEVRFDEAVVMQSRTLPTLPTPWVPIGEAADLADAGYGILQVRSVYDFDGRDLSGAGLEVVTDPLQTPVAERPARFVRIEKAVSLPSRNTRPFPQTAFGRSAAQGMREILGYAPVEPDGSVRVAVPANVALGITVLDAEGRRVSQRHQNWLTVRPGEELSCNGCHTGESTVPHGRADAEPLTINAGASTSGLPFPNTNPALLADLGETMAQTRSRLLGLDRLTPDIEFTDVWTDPAVQTPEADFQRAYADLSTPAPVSQACRDNWTSVCRIVINYETHIHPLWSVDRWVLDVDGVTVLNDRTCTSCHSPTDELDQPRVPAAQLDLSDGPSPDEADHFKAYRELLYPDNAQELSNGALVDRLIDTGRTRVDENGNVVPIFRTVLVEPSMSPEGALANDDFLARFLPGGSHAGDLSDAELKLITEWLDIGAQYFNNPFDAPRD